jgi:hypothetical protein
VPHFDRWTTGGYWAGIGLFVVAGLVLGVAQLHGREGNSQALFVAVFLPVLVVTGWVMLAAQPRGNWFAHHARSWSGDLGVGHVVHNLAEHIVVLAFGLGLVFGLTFEAGMIPRRRAKPAAQTMNAQLSAPVAGPPAPEPPAPEPPAPGPPVAEPPAEEPTVVVITDEPTVVLATEEPTVVRSPEPSSE